MHVTPVLLACADTFKDISSFSESAALKHYARDCDQFARYNLRQLSRVYPAGSRTGSSNYDPVSCWLTGCQLGRYSVLRLVIIPGGTPMYAICAFRFNLFSILSEE